MEHPGECEEYVNTNVYNLGIVPCLVHLLSHLGKITTIYLQ